MGVRDDVPLWRGFERDELLGLAYGVDYGTVSSMPVGQIWPWP